MCHKPVGGLGLEPVRPGEGGLPPAGTVLSVFFLPYPSPNTLWKLAGFLRFAVHGADLLGAAEGLLIAS